MVIHGMHEYRGGDVIKNLDDESARDLLAAKLIVKISGAGPDSEESELVKKEGVKKKEGK
jgi:hypothetical protein